MLRVAILGGGIAGLAAAYELEQHRLGGAPVDWHLFEASNRLGGTVATTRCKTSDGEYILEDGPDGWVTEKPWARDLAEELGLGPEIIPCNEADKRTYLYLNGQLVPMPARMRLMVPEDLSALNDSPLFSPAAKQAYAAELQRASELKAAIPTEDESVASFVRRHFGDEVLTKLAAPLLSGVFGGDVERLSVRAVMPAFVQMEAEYGSLIAALQAKALARGDRPPQPTFTSLRRGMGSLIEALTAALPADRLHTGVPAAELRSSAKGWLVRFSGPQSAACAIGFVPFDHVLLATSPAATRRLLSPIDDRAATLVPEDASSAVLATFCWPSVIGAGITLPPGFGFLVPQQYQEMDQGPSLLAATFTTQKFPHRAPANARILRALFGGLTAERLSPQPDAMVAAQAWRELKAIFPDLPDPDPTLTTVVRWPRSLPQYEVGHLDRMAELDRRVQALGHLHLLGNGYHGVGVPDLIWQARAAARVTARTLTESLSA